ncbi:MAG: SBBP repeat-containing protein [Pyrinomonadaceae bacterium]|nr:SBBP repeat-containing protein [Pyrinomonadaceae bacterium]
MLKENSNAKFFAALAVLSSLFFSTLVPNVSAETNETPTVSDANQSIQKDYGKMSLLFEENKGQTDSRAKFVSRGKGYTLYLAESEAVFSLKVNQTDETEEISFKEPKTKDQRPKTFSENLKMQFVGANKKPHISGESEAVTKTNYYIGKKRFENLANYRQINYNGLYHGIDAVFYGNKNNQLEYDFKIAPNADADQITLNFDGAKELKLDENGDLIAKTENAELVQQKPVAYQIINGERKEVAVGYKLSTNHEQRTTNKVSFSLGNYDKSQTLIIDPVLEYWTYIGGTALDRINEVAADEQGNAYIVGDTASLNFHGQTRDDNDKDGVFVAKLNADGTDFVYLTFLEGNNDDGGFGIALDAANNAYVSGFASHGFPTTPGAFSTVTGINFFDAFAAKLDGNGNLVYATYIGGTSAADTGFDIAVDSAGKAYVVGDTNSGITFPQRNRYQGCGYGYYNSHDGFLTVINASGSDLTYSTCIGGALVEDQAFGVAVDSANNAYVAGFTKGENFPTKNAFQPASGGGDDAWVAKFNPAASGEASLIYSSYLGGSGTESAKNIAVDSVGQAYITGITGSANFPLVNAFDTTNQINEAFVTMVNTSGTALVGSSFLGGADQEEGFNIAVDKAGSIYVTGRTLSNDFPVALPFQPTRRGVRDAFVSKVRFGRGVISSSFIGGNGNDFGKGIAVKGNLIYVAGETQSNNLLTTNGVIKPTSNASATNPDGFVAKILDTRLESVGIFRPNTTFSLTQSITNVIAQNATFTSPIAGQRGVSGDFDGDGLDSIGSFTNGTWKLRNSNFPIINLPAPLGFFTVTFGQAGDLPVVGDWNGDGIDTIAVFRPSAGQFFATNSLVANPPVDFTVTFGQNGDLPVAGDWNGDGIDTVGVYRPSLGNFFLTNTNDFNASVDVTAIFGVAEDLPFAGDFNGDGIDTISVFRPSVNTFFITNDNAGLATAFPFGQPTDQPIAGDWDGKPLP